MNFEQIQKLQNNYPDVAATVVTNDHLSSSWGIGLMEVLLILFYAQFLMVAITAIHCAHRGPKEGRTAWALVILAIPFLGWVCYWMISDRQKKDDGVFAGIR